MVYFVRSCLTGEVKIGYSRNVSIRMQWLVRDVGAIDLLAVIPGDMRVEHAHHARFKACRIRGEWFAPSDDLMSYVASLETCEPVGPVIVSELEAVEMPWELREEQERREAKPLPAWLIGSGNASDRGLPVKPPLKRQRP